MVSENRMGTERESGRSDRAKDHLAAPFSRPMGSPDTGAGGSAPEHPGSLTDFAAMDQILGDLGTRLWPEDRIQEFFSDVCRAFGAGRLRVLAFFPDTMRLAHVFYWHDPSLAPGVQSALEKNERFWKSYLRRFAADGFYTAHIAAESAAEDAAPELVSLQHVLRGETSPCSILLLEDIRLDRVFTDGERERIVRVHRVIQQWLTLSSKLADGRHVKSVDRLTGALTQASFVGHIGWLFAQEDGCPYALVNCSIDHFSEINDLVGRSAADAILSDFAGAVLTRLRSGECLGRSDAGIFWVLVRFTGRYPLGRRLDAWKRAFCQQTDRRGLTLHLSLSIGICAVSEYDRSHPLSCMQKAMFARKVSKTLPGETVRYYDRRLHQLRAREEDMDIHMVSSLTQRRFLVYLQPKYSVSDRRMVGAEALVRWKHPTRGFVMPDQFIPLFERNGFILQLDFYVLEEVCRFIRRWHAQKRPVVPVAVNFSRLHAQTRDFVPRILRTVREYGVSPSELEIEMTESAFVEEPANLVSVAAELRRQGFRIAMDDFGLGYSSLNSLESLPVDIIKMDKCFLSPRNSTAKAMVIVRELIHLAKQLHLCVVAEGVEFSWQADFLRGTDCDIMQGYLCSRPVPAETFEQMLACVARAADT